MRLYFAFGFFAAVAIALAPNSTLAQLAKPVASPAFSARQGSSTASSLRSTKQRARSLDGGANASGAGGESTSSQTELAH